MHIIPCKLLMKALGVPEISRESTAQVTMPVPVLRLLLEALLDTQDVDEQAYRHSNPDVAAAIKVGRIRSVHDHFRACGYFEGRRGAEGAFDEAWYIKRYADVRQAVAIGKYRTGREHYEAEGMLEWRSPNAAAEADLHRWREALRPRPAPSAPGPAPDAALPAMPAARRRHSANHPA